MKEQDEHFVGLEAYQGLAAGAQWILEMKNPPANPGQILMATVLASVATCITLEMSRKLPESSALMEAAMKFITMPCEVASRSLQLSLTARYGNITSIQACLTALDEAITRFRRWDLRALTTDCYKGVLLAKGDAFQALADRHKEKASKIQEAPW